MEVIAWTFNPSPERAKKLGVTFVEWEELLKKSDVLSLHVMLTEKTRGMIGAKELAMMKPGAIVLNGARGPVVDTPALAEAINSGHLLGAGIDVFDQEAGRAAHDPLLAGENVVLTPHCADMTPEGVHLLNSGAVGQCDRLP